jgi:NAD(P)-dependent dehydrogenase (short-subunit alcohol dehydrogenase family)
MGRFTNKIVVITGGTSGIGLAAARQFIKESATVVAIGRSPQSVGDAQKEFGANGIAITVTKSAELDAVFQTVREKYGRIDVLYANAGIAKLGSIVETTEDMFDAILNANFRAAYFTVAAPRRTPVFGRAEVASERLPSRRRRCREPGTRSWRYPNRSL